MDKAELEKAFEIAERWKQRVPDHMRDTVSGAIFEEMGILSRALLELQAVAARRLNAPSTQVMSDTPRTDKLRNSIVSERVHPAWVQHAEQLERELNAKAAHPEARLKWRLTADEKPEGHVFVICLWKDEVGVAVHTSGHRWHNPEDDDDDYREPDYWMYLPATMPSPREPQKD